jgi:acetylornithine/N-succinyldiaminopimelate aminotransferase
MTISVNAVREKAHDQHLLIATAGDDVVRLVPPLIMERYHVDEMIGKLEKAIVASK